LAALLAAATLQAAAPNTSAPTTNSKTNTAQSAEADLLALFKKESSTTNSLGSVMVWLPAGYRAGRTEVTQAEFEALMGFNPSHFPNPRYPVEWVSWTQASEFCRRLTEKEQKEGKLPKSYSYSLPTEAQWDYYVDAATIKDSITSELGDRRNPEPVGGLPPNSLGLHDTRGNVWEWCSTPVARGGSWRNHGDYLDPALRYAGTPSLTFDDIGFRIVLQSADPAR
jgi:formylglycine-generating enzyme required for sulfatase activity